jgi:hypothetical protein
MAPLTYAALICGVTALLDLGINGIKNMAWAPVGIPASVIFGLLSYWS